MTLRFVDVLYFLAEILVYFAVAWYGLTRDAPGVVRWCVGLGGVVVFAVTWGLFASPRASFALHGTADSVFRVLWFGLGAAAAIVVIAQRWSVPASR